MLAMEIGVRQLHTEEHCSQGELEEMENRFSPQSCWRSEGFWPIDFGPLKQLHQRQADYGILPPWPQSIGVGKYLSHGHNVVWGKSLPTKATVPNAAEEMSFMEFEGEPKGAHMKNWMMPTVGEDTVQQEIYMLLMECRITETSLVYFHDCIQWRCYAQTVYSPKKTTRVQSQSQAARIFITAIIESSCCSTSLPAFAIVGVLDFGHSNREL
ncbi:uncharacterized protein LOC111520376 [Piliocolobus tephrosceles]|uniref:uncharacterized protein LOC111520376 n=1 Tax=Piliocolobus tephrosceles TaxID=591936 RepID=UPI000C2B34FE|nr:uncharacterized protein LOC111520376 [Piliocolobus tephrosceles]